jgi:hypothetical protein
VLKIKRIKKKKKKNWWDNLLKNFLVRVLGGQISKFGDTYKISHANIKFMKTFGGHSPTHQHTSAPAYKGRYSPLTIVHVLMSKKKKKP